MWKWCFAALELAVTQRTGIQSTNLHVSTKNMGGEIWCKFLYIWHFLKMPFPITALLKSRAGTSEFPLLLWGLLCGSWEVGSAFPSPALQEQGVGVLLTLVQVSVKMIKSTGPELMLCSHPCVLWGEAGTILIFSSITSLLPVFFLTWILKSFHAGAFWTTLCDTNPRTNYWLIRIIAFKCQWALQFSAQREGGVVTTKLPPSPLCH